MNSLLWLLLYSLLGSVAGLIGGALFLWQQRFTNRFVIHAIPFAAGVMLTVSFLDLLPEATELLGSNSFIIIFLTFIVVFLVEKYLLNFHHHEDGDVHHLRSAVPTIIFGDTIHNFLDGVAIAGAFLVDPKLGLFVALATFLHETPHEIGDFAVLLSLGWKRKKIFLVNLISSLFTIPGAVLTYYFAPKIEGIEGYLIAIACGIFLHIAIVDFLPEVRKTSDKPWHQTIAFLLGIALIILVGKLIPH